MMDAHSCNDAVRTEGMTLGASIRSVVVLVVSCWLTATVWAEPWAAPGDARLRNDLQLLNDTGVINIPLTAWPVAWGDVYDGLADTKISGLSPDVRNSLTPTRQDIASVDLVHSRILKFGRIEVGLGIERTDDEVSGEASNDGRAFLQWRSSY